MKNRIEEYVKKYNINENFSLWDEYEPELIEYKKGSMVCMAGEAIDAITIIVEGKIGTSILSSDGRYSFIGVNEPTLMLGDMEFAGFGGMTESKALTDVVCVVIPFSTYRHTLERDIKFVNHICKNLAQKVTLATSDRYGQHFLSVKQRLSIMLLVSEINGCIDLNWTVVSEKIGVSYRQLMRVLASFCSCGAIKKGGSPGKYVICDKEILEKLSEQL